MKDIPGYEGLYAITSCGKVWSYRRKMFLKPTPDKEGYLNVWLSNHCERKAFKVHRLVAQAYIPNPDDKRCVNHKDEDKTHNWVNNLCWMTDFENCNYGTRNQRISEAKRKVKRNVPDL